jgi:hypothetical protein
MNVQLNSVFSGEEMNPGEKESGWRIMVQKNNPFGISAFS